MDHDDICYIFCRGKASLQRSGAKLLTMLANSSRPKHRCGLAHGGCLPRLLSSSGLPMADRSRIQGDRTLLAEKMSKPVVALARRAPTRGRMAVAGLGEDNPQDGGGLCRNVRIWRGRRSVIGQEAPACRPRKGSIDAGPNAVIGFGKGIQRAVPRTVRR